jgi:hypothetical protein
MRLVRLSGRTVINADAIARASESPAAGDGGPPRSVEVRYVGGGEELFEGEEAESLRAFLARASEPADSLPDFSQSDAGQAPRPLVSQADG